MSHEESDALVRWQNGAAENLSDVDLLRMSISGAFKVIRVPRRVTQRIAARLPPTYRETEAKILCNASITCY